MLRTITRHLPIEPTGIEIQLCRQAPVFRLCFQLNLLELKWCKNIRVKVLPVFQLNLLELKWAIAMFIVNAVSTSN